GLTGGGASAIAMDKSVKIVVDGQTQNVHTLASSVDGALASANLSPGSHDAVAPLGDSAITDGSTIVLKRGRLLTLTVDGEQQQVWTHALTVEEAMRQLRVGDEDVASVADRSRPIPLSGFSMDLKM